MADAYPNLTAVTTEVMATGYAYDCEFAFGLEPIIDALERALAGPAASRARPNKDPSRSDTGQGLGRLRRRDEATSCYWQPICVLLRATSSIEMSPAVPPLWKRWKPR